MNRAERSLLDAVAAGELDEHLDALAAAVSARQQLLHTVRSATRLMSLCEGDIVRINGRISPRYLAGLHATVLDDRSRRRDGPARAAGRAFRGRQGSRAGPGAREAVAGGLRRHGCASPLHLRSGFLFQCSPDPKRWGRSLPYPCPTELPKL